MAQKNRFEQQFFNELKSIFVGAKVEGESGYINLMRIKARYFEKGVFPRLQKDIDAAVKPFDPSFREELFDKLYDFFKRYFSESGSIYFRHTAPHHNVYERVYTDDRDVVLFWKTHMLYYVKTDRLFNSMAVTVADSDFYFDVSGLEHKKSNEKRELLYEFAGLKDGKIVLKVAYSEKGRKTKADDILKAARQAGLALDDDTLSQACRVFEKQSEVDYFINKDARAFLREQFDLWMYQYVFGGKTEWSATRVQQLQALKDIAFQIIDFIAQFEDELVRVWNKPKFARNAHYVITLDKLRGQPVFEKLLAHPGLQHQMEEWRSLGMLEADFTPGLLRESDLVGDPRHPRYRYLPLDTRYFPDLEMEMLALFDDLDAALDGWLIHSENYQGMNTLLPKFRGQIKCIHIDPPYNTDTSGFLYTNRYQHSSWLTMMANRVKIGQSFLDSEGSFLTHIDENEYDHLATMLREQEFPYQGTIVWDKKNPMMGGSGIAIQHEYIMWCSNHNDTFDTSSKNAKTILNKASEIIAKYSGVNAESRKEFYDWVRNTDELSKGDKAYLFIENDGRVYQSVGMGWPNPNPAPKQFFEPLIHPSTGKPCPVPPRGWSRSPAKMKELISKNEIIFGIDETTQPRRKLFLQPTTSKPISSIIQNGQKGKTELDNLGLVFSYCHPTSLYEELFYASLLGEKNGIVFDFFAGSGTTGHTVMNLNKIDNGKRRYILIELGEHFNTVILPRIKKVAFHSKWKDGRPVFEKGESGQSHFVKYYDLEQHEDALRRARYADGDLFDDPAADPYHSYVFLRDLKMLDAIDLDTKENRVHFHPERLYPDIDLAETLSCITGKWIKRIEKERVIFADGSEASLSDPDWSLIKPLVWWQAAA